MLPSALLLDFDGVIVDSENYHVASWQRVLLAMGREAPDNVCARAAEIDDRAFLAELFGEGIAQVNVEGWLRLKEAITEQMFSDCPRLYAGVRELIGHVVDAGVRVAVVSTTRRENITTVLSASGLQDAISTIVAKQDVIFGGLGETVTITHSTLSHRSYEAGIMASLRALASVRGTVVGLDQVINLSADS